MYRLESAKDVTWAAKAVPARASVRAVSEAGIYRSHRTASTSSARLDVLTDSTLTKIRGSV